MGREDALMARKITKRQQQIYDFIKEYQQEKGYPPSVREMASAVGLSSVNHFITFFKRETGLSPENLHRNPAGRLSK